MKVTKMLPAVLVMVTSCSITVLSQEPAKASPRASPLKPLAPAFQVCQGTYALCTFAQCGKEEKHKGEKPTVACACNVKHDYSVGTECEGPKKDPVGQTIVRSRYHPIDGYARCSNNKPWAMCLDSPCVIDKNDATKASCTCSVLQGKGDYVVTSSCTTGIISSATVLDLDKI